MSAPLHFRASLERLVERQRVAGASKAVKMVCSCRGSGVVLSERGGLAYAERCACRSCRICGGRGYSLTRNDAGYQTLMPCECADLDRRLHLWNSAMIPGHYARKGFDELEVKTAQAFAVGRARQFAAAYPEERRGLLFVGEPGRGKTHLMVAVLRVLALERGIACRFIDFFLLLAEMRAAWQADIPAAEILRPLKEVEILAIDELGKSKGADWETALLDEIIANRYNEQKTTLFTTNFPISVPQAALAQVGEHRRGVNLSATRETLEQRVGDRIYSRLKQMTEIIRLEGDDHRRVAQWGH